MQTERAMILAVAAGMVAANVARATDYALATNGNWTSPSTWTPNSGTPSSAADTASLGSGRTATLSSSITLGGLTISTGNVNGNGAIVLNGPLALVNEGGGVIGDGIDLTLNNPTTFTGPDEFSSSFASLGVRNTFADRDTRIIVNSNFFLKGRSGVLNVSVSPGSNYPANNRFIINSVSNRRVAKVAIDANDTGSNAEIQVPTVNNGRIDVETGYLAVALADGETSNGTFTAARPGFFGVAPTLRLNSPSGGTHTLGTSSTLAVAEMSGASSGFIEFNGSGTTVVKGSYANINALVRGGTVDFVSAGTVKSLQIDGGQLINRGGLSVTNTTQTGGKTTLAGNASGNITATGGTLAGVGGVSGNVTIGGNATFAPGNSPGEIDVGGSLSWRNGSTFAYDLGATSDLADVAGQFVKTTGGTGGYQFKFNYDASMTTGTYTLVEFASSSGFAVGDFSFVDVSGYGQLAGFFTLNSQSLTFTATNVVVPEPLTAMAAGLSVLAVRCRRRSR